MIEYKAGDLLNERVDALVNAVNCVGVMGKGIALKFRHAWPENFEAYAAACRKGEVRPGRMHVFETGRPAPRFIMNFPTKRHWRDRSRIEDIDAGLVALALEIRARGITSIALPALGAGLGGLDWPDVRSRIEGALGSLPGVSVTVFEPWEAGSPDGTAAIRRAARYNHSALTDRRRGFVSLRKPKRDQDP